MAGRPSGRQVLVIWLVAINAVKLLANIKRDCAVGCLGPTGNPIKAANDY